MIKIIKTVKELRKELDFLKKENKSVGLVPTMGALHPGHISLVKMSAKKCDITVVSIFVNPLQFGPNEDLDTYPRQLIKDTELAENAGANLIFAPTKESFYEPNHQTMIFNDEISKLYCGKYRPIHFQGVLTVVAKLFLAVEADWAFFGKKDYQQAYLIKKMVKDLNWNINIGVAPISREKSGLARSSRNEFLSAENKDAAKVIYASLKEAKAIYRAGLKSANNAVGSSANNLKVTSAKGSVSSKAPDAKGAKAMPKVSELKNLVKKNITKAGGKVQYVELVSQDTLLPVKRKLEGKVCMLVAAYFGETRLIDNIEL